MRLVFMHICQAQKPDIYCIPTVLMPPFVRGSVCMRRFRLCLGQCGDLDYCLGQCGDSDYLWVSVEIQIISGTVWRFRLSLGQCGDLDYL